ncbi:MAG: type II toxin-antitoxin system HicB family antitoxin [Alphaproteobacteria bacterium]|jgi:predicted RNase H-like HicB family nuclease|nr:type II toxin-antitoxin system HicB family antitoxin [Alphaproteobacteria bacterium]
MTYYVALIHKDADSEYGISFPDFPGCVSAGATVDEAVRGGAEALALHVEGLREDGAPVPAPRDLAEIRAAGDDWIVWEGAVAVLVPLLPPEGRAVRVNVTLDAQLLARIDAVSRNRSGFLAEAAERLLAG